MYVRYSINLSRLKFELKNKRIYRYKSTLRQVIVHVIRGVGWRVRGVKYIVKHHNHVIEVDVNL